MPDQAFNCASLKAVIHVEITLQQRLQDMQVVRSEFLW